MTAWLRGRWDADRVRLGLRLVILAASCFTAGAPVLREGYDTIRAGSPLGWVMLAPVVACAVALLRHRGLARTIHVHDRHFDLLILVSLLVVIATTVTLLTDRVGWAATNLRLDILMGPLWIAAATVALFGTRPMFEQLPSLWVTGAMWPFPYAVIGAYVPMHRLGWVIVAWIGVVATVALHHTGWGGVVAAALFATSNVSALAIVAPALAPLGIVLGPTVILLIARWRRWPNVFTLARTQVPGPPPPLAVLRGRRAAGALLIAAATAGVLIQGSLAQFRAPVGATMAQRCPRPEGWELLERDHVAGGSERTGGAWGRLRCRYRIADDAGTRDVALDISDPLSSFELGAYPTPVVLRARGRLDPVQRTFDLDDGEGEVFAFSDPSIPTELVMATVDVGTGRNALRRVTVLVPDDRRPSVVFPDPDAKPLIETVRRFSVVVRSRTDQLERYAVTPKDVDLAETLLRVAVSVGTEP